jgi:hypothetical protein
MPLLARSVVTPYPLPNASSVGAASRVNHLQSYTMPHGARSRTPPAEVNRGLSTSAGAGAASSPFSPLTPHVPSPASVGLHAHGHYHAKGLSTSEVNRRINAALRSLYQEYRPGGPQAVSSGGIVGNILKRIMHVHMATFLSVLFAIVSTAATSTSVSFVALNFCLTLVIVYGVLVAVESFHLWARSVELRRRMLYALSSFSGEGATDVVPAGSAFSGTFNGLRGLLSSRSFHLQQVLRDGRFVCVPKALTVDGDFALDTRPPPLSSSDCLKRVRAPRQSHVIVAITSILTRKPIQLAEVPPSVFAASPPARTPATAQPPLDLLEAAANRADSTSDTSDDDSGPRSTSLPDSPSTPTEQMEYCVFRALGLLWTLFMPILVLVQLLYVDSNDALYVEQILLQPVVALLGLLPFSALFVGRLWGLWSNLVLVSRLKWLLRHADRENDESDSDNEDRELLAVAEGRHDFQRVLKRLFHMLRIDGSQPAMCFSRSPVHTLGSATVIASLDGEGTLTETVPVPMRVIYVKGRPPPLAEPAPEGPVAAGSVAGAASGLEGDAEITRSESLDLPKDFTAAYELLKRERAQKQLAQKYGEQRFKQLELHHSSSSDKTKVVTFVESITDGPTTSLSPLGLCALLHSVHATSALRGRDAPKDAAFIVASALDTCVLWGRSLHWLSRALEIPDAIATRFKLLRRVLILDRRVPQAPEPAHLRSRAGPVAQKCGLFFEAPGGELHLYVIGTMGFVLDSCPSCWDGSGVGACTDEDRQISTTMALRWPSRCSRVACAFRVLPERYRDFIVPKAKDPLQQSSPPPPSQSPPPQTPVTGAPSPLLAPPGGTKKGASGIKGQWSVAEEYYLDGKLIFSTHPAANVAALVSSLVVEASRKHHHHHHGRHHHRHRYHGQKLAPVTFGHRRTRSDGDYSAVSGPPSVPARTPTLTLPESAAGTSTEFNKTGAMSQSFASLEPDSNLGHANAAFLAMTCQQTFLGVIGLFDFVRPRVESSITTLNNAGIRFVHFGSGTLQEVRSFGAGLGLKDEHNNCISLREKDLSIDDAYHRARLPCGVDNIRKHLVTTDAIPLKVPMFCGARSVRTRSMVSVMQDNHEVVVGLGSPFNHSNVRALLQADISISAEPCLRRGAAVDGEDVINRAADELFFRPDPDTDDQMDTLKSLLSTACALTLTPTTQTLPMVVSLIRQARLLLKQLAQCTDFIVQCGCGVTLLHVTTLLLTGGPLFLGPEQTLFLLNVIVPCVGFGVAYTPKDVDVMVLLPTKHDAPLRVSMMWQWFVWWVVRFVPTAIVAFAVGAGVQTSMMDSPRMLFFSRNAPFDAVGAEATEAFCFLSLTYLLCWLSRTYLSRHTTVPVYLWDPAARETTHCALTCGRWLACCGVAILTAIIVALCTTSGGAWDRLAQRVPLWCLLLVLLWPVAQSLIDIPMKRKRQAAYTFQQKLMKMRFTTRLGMYSPVGSEDAFHEERPEQHCNVHEVKQVNPVVRFLTRWISIDNGKAERQCVCEVRGL